MESNRDESERCYEFAQKFIRTGEYNNASKFLLKANRLYPSQKVIDLLQQVNLVKSKKQSRVIFDDSHTQEIGDKKNKKVKMPAKDYNYAEEDLEAVKRIKRCKNYYEILSISVDSTDIEIKKAYKKSALQFHPDKNKTPGAGEAFKAIGNAFATLSDPQKRKIYDLRAADDKYTHRHSRSDDFEYDYNRGFNADMSAQDIFNLFFGGPAQNRTFYRYYDLDSRSPRSTQTNPNRNEEQPNHSIFLQMLPIFFLILLSLFSNFFVSDPPYKFHNIGKYIVPLQTQDLEIRFFVKINFQEKYGEDRTRLEKEIERAYYKDIEQQCYDQMTQRSFLLRQAEFYGNQNMRDRAERISTASCDIYNQLRDKIHSMKRRHQFI